MLLLILVVLVILCCAGSLGLDGPYRNGGLGLGGVLLVVLLVVWLL